MIYVEYQDATSQAPNPPQAWRGIGWWAVCDDCGWSSGPHDEQDDAIREADAHALAMGEATPQELEPSERPAAPGEFCTCGRQAVVVYLGGILGPTGYCGVADGGDRRGPCPFCGGPRHTEPESRCPHYRLRLDQP